ncbi:type IX secretion/gliding motility protein PorT/SprT [Tangfeifania diversioriginum]|nr:outer membrane beta-barrel protein [Tangfeifania diversioriginum]
MRKIFTVIFLVLIAGNLLAQKQKVNHMTTFDDKLLHFGFTLGMNTLDFGIVHYNPIGSNPDFTTPPANTWYPDEERITGNHFVRADIEEVIPGFTVGIVSSLRLTRDLNLRFLPGLSFGERILTYNQLVVDYTTSGFSNRTYDYSVKSTFLDFPLLIKYKARRINNDRPYVIFGGAYRQDISRTGGEDLVRLTNGGFYAEIGAGWDHYFTFFRFSVEAKVSLGLNNQLGDPPQGDNQRKYYTHAFESLRSNIFTLCFHFE